MFWPNDFSKIIAKFFGKVENFFKGDEEKSMLKIAILLFGLLAIPSGQALALTISYGNPVIARSVTSASVGYEQGALIMQTARTALFDGAATSWSVYSTTGGTGSIAAVILKPTATPGYYTITGVSEATISNVGVNTFAWTPSYGTSNVTVGSIFGIWLGTTGIDRNTLGTSTDPIAIYSNPSPGTDFGPYTPNRVFTGLYPTVASLWTAYEHGLGSGIFNDAYFNKFNQNRTYSFEITVVPEASSLGLMSLAIAGLAWSRRKKAAALLAC